MTTDLIKRLSKFVVDHGYEQNDREYNGQCLGCMAHPEHGEPKATKHYPGCVVKFSEEILKEMS